METYGTYLDRLKGYGLAYTHFIEGVTYTTREWPDDIDFTELRRRSPGAYVANNELSLEEAERLIADDEADLVSFARAYIANPDLVERIRIGGPLAEAPKEYWVRRRQHRLFRLAGHDAPDRLSPSGAPDTQGRRRFDGAGSVGGQGIDCGGGSNRHP